MSKRCKLLSSPAPSWLLYRITFLREPSTSFVRRYLERQDAAGKVSTNHPFAGFTDPKAKDGAGAGAAPPQPPPGFQERTVRCDTGRLRGILYRHQPHPCPYESILSSMDALELHDTSVLFLVLPCDIT